MLVRLVKTGTRLAFAVPRLALQAAGTAWEVADHLVDRLRATEREELPPLPPMPAPPVTVTTRAPDHDALPLEDFDHLTVGAVRSRIRPLPLDQVRQLHSYEVEHANRLPVVTVLANRIAQLEQEQPTPAPR